MSKIICDICGTSYPDTADQCPICGCAKDMTVEALLGETIEEEVTETVQERPKGGRFASSNVRKRNARYEEEEDEDEDDDDYEEDDDDDEYEDEDEKSNAPLVVLLVIVIVALLAVGGFIFVKYFLPNMNGGEETVPATTAAATTLPQETTAPVVPCTSLVLTSGTDILLEDVGFSWLIHISALPENTTDQIVFASSDESVAVVGADGTVTAVGEGTAVITITCGTEQLSCNVVCDFTPETTVPETTVPGSSEPEESVAETGVPETTVPETTAPEADLPDVTISFFKSDVTSRMIGEQFYLKVLPSDLDPKLVTWTSENERICVVDEEGLVTIKGYGTTHVYAEYKGQKIECIVRVI